MSSEHKNDPENVIAEEVGIAASIQHPGDRDYGDDMPHLIARLTPEERGRLEKRLLRRIDLRLIPMVLVMYILNFLDRTAIASARLAGLEEDLKLDKNGHQYSTAVSILFVGYILMQVPSNLLLNKLGKPGIYLPSCVVVWGIISASTAALQSYHGLLACRFLLGFVEAAYFPGVIYLLSCWYTRQELVMRNTFMFTGAYIAGATSGLIAAGITSHMDGTCGLRAWRWLFLLEGSATVAVAGAAALIMPNLPRTTAWLSEEEAAMATWRLKRDIGEDDWVSSEEQTFVQGLMAAVRDIKTWVLLVMMYSANASASITNFFPSLVQTMGYSRVKTLLLTVPPNVLGVLTMLLNAWHADRTGERFLHFSLPLCVAVASFIIAATTNSLAVRYVAIMFMVPGVSSGFTPGLSWISSTLPRPPAKRAAALALISAASNVSPIFTSYLYPANAAPHYKAAYTHNSLIAALAVAMAAVLRIMLAWLNRKMQQDESNSRQDDSGKEAATTTKAMRGDAVSTRFRYLL